MNAGAKRRNRLFHEKDYLTHILSGPFSHLNLAVWTSCILCPCVGFKNFIDILLVYSRQGFSPSSLPELSEVAVKTECIRSIRIEPTISKVAQRPTVSRRLTRYTLLVDIFTLNFHRHLGFIIAAVVTTERQAYSGLIPEGPNGVKAIYTPSTSEN